MNLNNLKRIIFSVILGNLFLAGLLFFLNGTPTTVYADAGDLFVTLGGGGNCAQAAPCDLQTALGLANNRYTIYIAEGTYTGAGGAVITVTHSITLAGGWDGSAATPPVRDPEAHPAIIDGEGTRRGIFINAAITPTIDGFIITRGNATDLGGGLTSGADAGGGLYSSGASPIIQNSIITNNVGSTLAGVRSFGGGIAINGDGTTVVIRHNQIFSNTAGIGIAQGDGGGLFVNGSGEVSNNTFRDNRACPDCVGNGGGMYLGWTNSDILIAENLFDNNEAGDGGGLAIVWSTAQVNENTFTENTALFGAGVYAYYDGGSNLNANMIISNTGTGPGNGLYLRITVTATPMRLVNNIIADNQGGAGGVYASSDWHSATISLTHNTIANNGTGVIIGTNMTATLTNNIIAGHTTGIMTSTAEGHVFADHTLFWDNTDDGIPGTNTVDGDPDFVNPDGGDYHIASGSAAIDTGIDAGITTDIDGNARPIKSGFDIGADEAMWMIYLPLVLKN